MIRKQCAVCNKEFNAYPSKIKQGRGKYCSRNCSDTVTLIRPDRLIGSTTQFTKGQKPHNYKGWRLHKSRPNGQIYKQIHMPNHPSASRAGYVMEHRLVMEEELGRLLDAAEVVDHINRFDTLNNSPSNLRVMQKVEHDRMNVALNIHRRWYANPNTRARV